MKIEALESFHSIQGEGPRAGVNSFFVRLAGCNLRCSFCDTAYSWHEKPLISIDPKDFIETMSLKRCRNVVFTGGEPLLQSEQLQEFIKEMVFHSGLINFSAIYSIEVETNGTLGNIFLPSMANVAYNVSIKLSNSGMPENKRVVPHAIEKFVDLSYFDKAIFKFVVGDESDFDEVDDLVRKFIIPHRNVWIMPLGTDPVEITKTAQFVFQRVVDSGYNLSLRNHIIIGAK